MKDERGYKPHLNINSGFNLCKVDNHTNYIISASYAYLIDLKKNIVKSMPRITLLHELCSLVYKDKYIYAFQEKKNQPSYRIKMNTMKWQNISNMPIHNNYGI